MHWHHLTPKPRYFNQDRENSPKPLSPEKRTDTNLFISPGALPEGRGREKGGDRRESKRIHSTSRTEENWGEIRFLPTGCVLGGAGWLSRGCLPSLHPRRGAAPSPAGGELGPGRAYRTAGGWPRSEPCWRRALSAVPEPLAAVLKPLSAVLKPPSGAREPPPTLPVPSDLPGALNALPCCPPALRSHSARASVFSSVVCFFF